LIQQTKEAGGIATVANHRFLQPRLRTCTSSQRTISELSVLFQNRKYPISKLQVSYYRFQINHWNCLRSFLYTCN